MGKKVFQLDHEWLTAIRRDFHKYPELSYRESRTSEKVADILADLGFKVHRGIAKTGVVATLGNSGGPCLGFRADMDALPIQEAETPLNGPYRSVRNGVMHACGHDANTTIMLGVARVLAENPDILSAAGICVKFLFQPAEESGAGAKQMIEEGALESPRPTAIISAHMSPDLQVGWVGLSKSLSHASADTFRVKVVGKGGHAARPHQSRDPIVAASHLVVQLQTIVSRWIDPLDSAVVTIGRIAGGSASNVIPTEVEMEGTIRSIRKETRQLVWDRIQDVAKACELGFHVTCLAEREEGYPPCVNDVRMTKFLKKVCSDLLGKSRVQIIPPSMGAEDFSYYASVVPGAILRLGCANLSRGICRNTENHSVIGLHNPNFDIDKTVLDIGVKIFVQAVLRANRLNFIQG